MRIPFRSIGTVVLAYSILAGSGYFLTRKMIMPLVFGETLSTTEIRPQDNVERPDFILLGDTFSGYSTFRNGAFQGGLKDAGLKLQYRDEFNQAARAQALSAGDADFLVTTLDQFLRHAPNGQIVGLIDRTVGADAAVLNTPKYPQLDSLLDLQQLVERLKQQNQKPSIVYAGDTPSEYLALVLDTKFDTFNLSDFNVIEVADASEAWDVLQDESQNVAIAILWEPFVAQAREQGHTVVLSSRDTPKSIIDVIVASDRLIAAQPEQVSNFLETYYRRIDTNMRSATELQTQVAEDGELSPQDAATVLEGIDFFTAAEADNWMKNGTLTQRIQEIASVLTRSGKLEAAPRKPERLYTTELLANAAKNTRAIIDVVRADNPKLAAKLEGTIAGSPVPVSTRQVQGAPSIGNLKVQGEVRFARGSIQLAGQGLQTLDRLAAEITEFNPDTVAVRVIGHTSQVGPPQVNQLLSQQRADVVAQYLQNKGLKQKIIAEGKGASVPLPKTAPKDAKNQRTEIRLVRIN